MITRLTPVKSRPRTPDEGPDMTYVRSCTERLAVHAFISSLRLIVGLPELIDNHIKFVYMLSYV
jgi:hypothetical protein